VTGTSYGGATSQDFVTVKYSPAGETLWVRSWNGTGAYAEDKPACLLVDASQNIYVGGYTEGWGTGRDFAVVKYSRHGDTLWSRRYNGTADGDDEVVGIGTDDRGRVYVAGYSTGTGTFADYCVICYSPLGESLWAYRWDYSGYGNWPTALTVDGDGNSYVTGYGFDPATQYDFHTISLSPDGIPRWQVRYNGYADDWDQPVAIGLDAARNVYVTGFSMSNAQGFDYVTIKYVQSPGIEEETKGESGGTRASTAFVRGVLLMPSSLLTANFSLLSIDGRKVLDLRPGPNDVSHLTPGVYFLRPTDGGKRSAFRKVLVTR